MHTWCFAEYLYNASKKLMLWVNIIIWRSAPSLINLSAIRSAHLWSSELTGSSNTTPALIGESPSSPRNDAIAITRCLPSLNMLVNLLELLVSVITNWCLGDDGFKPNAIWLIFRLDNSLSIALFISEVKTSPLSWLAFVEVGRVICDYFGTIHCYWKIESSLLE